MSLPKLSKREWMLLSSFSLLLLAALCLPEVPVASLAGSPFAYDPPASGLSNLMELMSSLPMAVVGFWGLRWLHWQECREQDAEDAAPVPQAVAPAPANPRDCAWMFFAGLILTAAAVAFYHLQPDAVRLAADRAGIAVAFAGLVGFAVCERVSIRAGWPAAWFTLAGGLLAAMIGERNGDALPWALVQFGGLALMVALALLRPIGGAVGLRLGWVIFVFVFAKTFELLDHQIYAISHQWLSGFGLKHLTAAGAALIVLHGLQAMGRQSVRHNPGVAVTV